MRRFLAFACAVLLCAVSAPAQQQPPAADRVLANAKAAAAQQHKHIFLAFGASWCPPCKELEAFLADRDMRRLIDKHFFVAHLSVEEERGKHPELNSPGAEQLRAGLGGKDSGVPFIVFLDEQGHSVIDSNRPVKDKAQGENVGYPVLPEEIDWFMTMLKRAVPVMTKADAGSIESWLRKVAARQPQ